MTKIDICDTQRNNLIAAALGLQHCTRTAANIVPLPGTDRFIAIGTALDVARLLEIAPASADNPSQEQKDEQDMLAAIYPPKALLKREDWDPITRKPRHKADNPSTAGADSIDTPAFRDLLGDLLEAYRDELRGGPSLPYENVRTKFIAHIEARLAAPVAQSTAGAAKGALIKHGDVPSIEITLRQAKALVDFFGGFDGEVSVIERPAAWADEPEGLYAYCTEYPDEGSQYLGPTVVDDELATNGERAAPALNPSEVPQWISVEDRLPAAENEDTGRDAMVSDSLFIRGVAIDGGEAIGLGDYSPDAHVPDAGWRCYGGDYDFMHFAKVTHWMKPGRPAAPEHSALRTASKEGGANHG